MTCYRLGSLLVSLSCTFGLSSAVSCYKCSVTDISCPVVTSETPTEECSGYCLTRIQWKFRDTVREVNISRSCEPSCSYRTYLYGYFDSVEDICCGDDLCNTNTKPSGYSKCHYCHGDGEESCFKNDFVKLSPEAESQIFCVGKCAKVVSDGKYEGNDVKSVLRTCNESCQAGTKPLLDRYGDTKIGTTTTHCCEGDLCNRSRYTRGSALVVITAFTLTHALSTLV